jgi:predicted HD superfamily hydrolase involved in NAD metabolism
MREQVLTWLTANVPESRIRHILRVEQMAIELAQRHDVDAAQAAQAGLLHDLAKFFKPQRLLAMAQAEGSLIDPVDVADPRLLHATVGAIVARDEFGVVDAEVLAAIRNHTLGEPGMSALSCVVYLADSLEAGRGDTPELAELRQLSQQDLHLATWRTADYSLKYLLAARKLIHPRAILTRNWFMEAVRDRKSAKSITVGAP